MNTFTYIIAASASALVCIGSALAQIPAAESREALLAKAERFQVVPVQPATIERYAVTPDPFNSPAYDDPNVTTTLRSASPTTIARLPMTDRVRLQEISEKIRPTGVMQFGQDVLLLFGERRVRVGEFLSVEHQGQTYRVEVVKADSRAFMLRLNEELVSKRIQ